MRDLDLKRRLADNLIDVKRRIDTSCAQVGRNPQEVTLIAVTKYVSVNVAAKLVELGVVDLGESRPQELWNKSTALPSMVRWHLIGHLQRNKVERTLPICSLIHSIDSIRLLECVEDVAARQDREVSALIEVNLSAEVNKTGLHPDDLSRLMEQASESKHVRIRGLMTMAPQSNLEQARNVFVRLRELAGPGKILSMGMSDDFECAIKEGATHIRLGSILFAGIAAEHLRE